MFDSALAKSSGIIGIDALDVAFVDLIGRYVTCISISFVECGL